MTEPGYLLITGMGRSGTTLLDKLLSAHPEMSVLSQPFPLLWVRVLRDFLQSLGRPAASHPLGHCFVDSHYSLERLIEFLDDYRLESGTLRAAFDEMADYSGQYHKPADLAERIADVEGGSFLNVFQRLALALRHRDDARVFGVKETHCEEFLPFLVERSVKCVLVVRDPRDVICSFCFGQGQRYGGASRPVLFYVRNWRKSVAFALQLENEPNFLAVRYEDLVRRPQQALGRIADFLGVATIPDAALTELRDQGGDSWNGNSSMGEKRGIDTGSIGRFHQQLPPATRRYVELFCGPEMCAVGYGGWDPATASGDVDWQEVNGGDVEPVAVDRPEFAKDYSVDSGRLEQERRRLELVRVSELPVEEESLFLSPRVHQRLWAACFGNSATQAEHDSGWSGRDVVR